MFKLKLYQSDAGRLSQRSTGLERSADNWLAAVLENDFIISHQKVRDSTCSGELSLK